MPTLINTTDTQAEWQTGTLDGVIATATGDLELASTTPVLAPHLSFDGANNYVTLGAVNFNTPELTFECICSTDSLDDFRTLFSWGLWSDPLSFYIRSGGAQASIVGLPATRVEHDWNVPAGTEVHVAAVFSTITGTIKTYINGVLNGTSTNIDTDGRDLPVTGELYLGANTAPDSYFDGYMREIRFWTTARTAEQIARTMDTSLIGTEHNLVAYYPADEGSGTTLTDATGNGHTGTLVGTGWGTSAGFYQYNRVSPAIDITSLGATTDNVSLSWTATDNGEYVKVEYSISYDLGATWGYWVTATNGSPIETLALADVSTIHIRLRQVLGTVTNGITPQLHDMTLSLEGTAWVQSRSVTELESDAPVYPLTPHKLSGQTLLDGQPVRRRVEVRFRDSSSYVISTVTQGDGAFEFRRLPTQTTDEPYCVLCLDDSDIDPVNALIYDHVYQVDDNGNPPTE